MSDIADGWKHFNDRVRDRIEGEYGEFTNADWQAAIQMSERITDLERLHADAVQGMADEAERANRAEAQLAEATRLLYAAIGKEGK